jgi:predicted outer membrane repeat protein
VSRLRLPCLLLSALLLPTTVSAAEVDDDSDLLLLMPSVLAKRLKPWSEWPAAGNPSGRCSTALPADASEEDTSTPDHVIGNGTPQSCTSEAVVATIAKGGVITFNCGPRPIIISMQATAKIVNNTGPRIVIDGKGKVALSGGNARRILYMNTCDQAQVWTTSHCQDQDHPRLTVQNLTFLEGNSADQTTYDGGGAIWARGGRLKIVNSRFFSNTCAATGPDVGGAAVRAFDQSQDRPLYVVNSTFGGRADLGNTCSNGGGLSAIGVSYSVYNSLFSHNHAIGWGANPARGNTPGGGSGGAIYNDGNTFNLTLCGSRIENNTAREGGGAIFFVSNNLSGHLLIRDSRLSGNPSDGFETQGYPGIFYLGSGNPQVSNSVIE